MGDIYRATDATLGRPVAVKLLAERYSRDDAVRRRFTREALAAARLSGEPYVVNIFDVGEHSERPFIVMEYLAGGSLEDRIRTGGAQPPGQALEWLEQAALALDAAHRHGVVHRDVKPANLLLDRNGNVHVADFGVASAAGMESLTMTGTVLGTAGYLSPEQAQGQRASPASDRYSLAVVAFELLSGKRPFETVSMTAEAAAHVNDPVPSIAQVFERLPHELDPVFRRAMAKDPAARYPTTVDFVADLRAALADAAGTTRPLRPVAAARPVTRRRTSAWAGLLALLAVGGIAGAIAAAVVAGGGGKKTAKPPPARNRTVVSVHTVTAPTTSPPAPVSGDGRSLNDRGYTLMQAGRYNEALPLLQAAVPKLHGDVPYEAYANYNLGYTLLQLGRCGVAIGYLETAQQLEPTRPEPKDAAKRAKHCATGKGKGHGHGEGD
jgi:predicted Ser/Thr protein kinase